MRPRIRLAAFAIALAPHMGLAESPTGVEASDIVGPGLNWAGAGIGVVNNLGELQSSYRALHATDATCMNLSSAGAPPLPSNCAEGSACGQCFADGRRQLDGMRLNLERLRCTYTAYKRYVDAAVSFGDSTSGIHAVTGLAWQTERAGIMKEFQRLQSTYDNKYQAMLPNLQAALQKIGQCEAQFYNNPDWYSRFGFIYYTFMADRYKR
jgi:hypothetical protein